MAEPPDTLHALGLTNPFATPSDDLFGGGDRMRQLDELRHLSRWSRRLLVVTGERGIGKSTLYRALSSRLDPGVKAARINANLANEARELLTSIVQGFGIATPAKVTPELLGDLICVHVAEQAQVQRACVVLVDDAHQVELRALDHLLRLMEPGGDDGLRIVFFGEAYFVQMLDKAVARLPTPLAWHEIRLSPFSDEEVRQYLKFRFEGAGHDGPLPFTDGELQGIVGASGGLPGKVDEMASAILRGVMTVRDAPGWLPPWHRALAALLVVALGITWLVWDSSDGDDTRSVKNTPVPIASGRLPERPTVLAATERASPALIDENTTTTDLPSTGLSAPAATSAVAAAATPAPAATSSPAPATQAESGGATVATPVVAESANRATNDESKPLTPPAAPAPKREAVAAAKPRNALDVKWIDDQADDRFTLQLLGTSSRARAEEYVASQSGNTPAVAFLSERNASPWYVVIYGSYESADAASKAAKRLPATIGKVTPWVRRFGAVRADIKR